ncbi:hypothetical protein WR25_08766 [Diploscapter pachys]|uniref:Uncharacterized protein n=1 Tax=Diploscapter pachys TaxID=2018661 RepID=A0A2A2K7C8_9BILA|nr:hypothetical protein WR25_08766 [Diploscapter pachys]
MRLDCDEGFDIAVIAQFVVIALDDLAADRAFFILAGDGALRHLLGRDLAHAAEDLGLFVADRGAVVQRRRLHRDQRDELEHMIMVDAERPLFGEGAGDGVVDLLRRGEVVAQRLFERDAHGRPDGEAARHVADLVGERLEAVGVGQIGRLELDALHERAERAFVLAVGGEEFVERLLHDVAIAIVVHVAARRAGDRQILGQQAVGVQAVQRGQQHALGEDEAGERIEPGHDVEVLHRRAARALAEIVERRDQPDVAGAGVAADAQRHAVGARILLDGDCGDVARRDRNERAVGIGRGQRVLDLRDAGAAGQLRERQRHFGQHAAVEPRDRRREDRWVGEAGVRLHLGQMLVREGEGVDAEGGVGAAFFELGDHCLPAAGIARGGVIGQRPVGGHKAGADKRGDEREERGGVAAGVGDAWGLRDPVRLACVEFGEAIGPARRDPMRRRCVDDPRATVADERGGFLRSLIGQAEDREIGVVQRLGSRSGVLATRLIERHDGEIATAAQPFADVDAGGADRTVDEDRDGHAASSCGTAISKAHVERIADAEIGDLLAEVAIAEQSDSARHDGDHRRGIMGREDLFGEADVCQIAANGVGTRIEIDRGADIALVAVVTLTAQIAEGAQPIQGARDDGLRHVERPGQAAHRMRAGIEVNEEEQCHLPVGEIGLARPHVIHQGAHPRRE